MAMLDKAGRESHGFMEHWLQCNTEYCMRCWIWSVSSLIISKLITCSLNNFSEIVISSFIASIISGHVLPPQSCNSWKLCFSIILGYGGLIHWLAISAYFDVEKIVNKSEMRSWGAHMRMNAKTWKIFHVYFVIELWMNMLGEFLTILGLN